MKSLYQELQRYSASNIYPFHMPGHKRQGVFGMDSCLDGLHGIDITEIDGFDDLHHATGILKEAQDRVASMYHSKKSYFLVNGSTGGILSAIAAVSKENKKILVARNCHKSVYHGLLLNRLEAEYIWPEYVDEYDISGQINPNDVRDILKGNAEFSAIILTSPTYDGVVSDVKGIAQIAHEYGIPVIVDEAHGAHLALDERFPESAVSAGADLVINSTHKTLPALTQTAILHLQGDLVDQSKLEKYLQIYQTSSPSYVLMSSIDECFSYLQDRGQKAFDHLYELRKMLEEGCKNLKHLRLMKIGDDWDKAWLDPGKILISTKGTTKSGRWLAQQLLETYAIQMEMSAPTYCLGILTAQDTAEGICRLVQAISELDEQIGEANLEDKKALTIKNRDIRPKQVCSLFQAEQYEKQSIDLQNSLHKICGAMVMLYPPGIPLVVPGEEITETVLEELECAILCGFDVLGLEEERKKICIIRDHSMIP